MALKSRLILWGSVVATLLSLAPGGLAVRLNVAGVTEGAEQNGVLAPNSFMQATGMEDTEGIYEDIGNIIETPDQNAAESAEGEPPAKKKKSLLAKAKSAGKRAMKRVAKVGRKLRGGKKGKKSKNQEQDSDTAELLPEEAAEGESTAEESPEEGGGKGKKRKLGKRLRKLPRLSLKKRKEE